MFSMMTKILAAATATSAVATGISVYRDLNADIKEIPDEVENTVEDTAINDTATEILNSAE